MGPEAGRQVLGLPRGAGRGPGSRRHRGRWRASRCGHGQAGRSVGVARVVIPRLVAEDRKARRCHRSASWIAPGRRGFRRLMAQSDISTVRMPAADTRESDDRDVSCVAWARLPAVRRCSGVEGAQGCRESDSGYDHTMRTDELSRPERSTRHVTCSCSQSFRLARRLQRRR